MSTLTTVKVLATNRWIVVHHEYMLRQWCRWPFVSTELRSIFLFAQSLLLFYPLSSNAILPVTIDTYNETKFHDKFSIDRFPKINKFRRNNYTISENRVLKFTVVQGFNALYLTRQEQSNFKTVPSRRHGVSLLRNDFTVSFVFYYSLDVKIVCWPVFTFTQSTVFVPLFFSSLCVPLCS